MHSFTAVEEEIRRGVHDARAKDPLIRVMGLRGVLEEHFGRDFSHQYVSKFADKVAREGLIEADRIKLEEHLQFTRENNGIVLATIHCRDDLQKWSFGHAKLTSEEARTIAKAISRIPELMMREADLNFRL